MVMWIVGSRKIGAFFVLERPNKCKKMDTYWEVVTCGTVQQVNINETMIDDHDRSLRGLDG